MQAIQDENILREVCIAVLKHNLIRLQVSDRSSLKLPVIFSDFDQDVLVFSITAFGLFNFHDTTYKAKIKYDYSTWPRLCNFFRRRAKKS